LGGGASGRSGGRGGSGNRGRGENGDGCSGGSGVRKGTRGPSFPLYWFIWSMRQWKVSAAAAGLSSPAVTSLLQPVGLCLAAAGIARTCNQAGLVCSTAEALSGKPDRRRSKGQAAFLKSWCHRLSSVIGEPQRCAPSWNRLALLILPRDESCQAQRRRRAH
jgi:hypothetical protein